MAQEQPFSERRIAKLQKVRDRLSAQLFALDREIARARRLRTPGKSFTVQVNMALIRGPFRREGRGVYTAE